MKYFTFDIETTGLCPYTGSRIFAYCIGDESGNVDVYRINPKNNFIKALKSLFIPSEPTGIIIHNAKFELSFLDVYNIRINRNVEIHDTMIMSQLLRNNAPSHKLDYLAWELCGYEIETPLGTFKSKDIDKVVNQEAGKNGIQRGKGLKPIPRYDRVNKTLMHWYQVADGQRPMLLFLGWIEYFKKNPKLWEIYRYEIEYLKIAQKMEKQGINISVKNCKKLLNELEPKVSKIEKQITKLLGKEINLDSDAQIQKALYVARKLPVVKRSEKTGLPSTDKDTLLKLYEKTKDEILHLILQHRSYTKNGIVRINGSTKGKEKNGFLQLMGPDNVIHHSINTNEASTGRQSIRKPSLQNTPKSAALKNIYPVPLRNCIEAPKGYMLLSTDYSGIEMRLIIDAAQETELIEYLNTDPSADMHHPTVECFMMQDYFTNQKSEVFKKGIYLADKLRKTDKEKYKILRGAYKNTGFCIGYGGGTDKVAFTLGKNVDEILVGDTNYRKRFPKIANFSRQLIKIVQIDGYVKTGFGRMLRVPKNKAYISSNYCIQGTAAEILKRAMTKVYTWQKKEKLIKYLIPILPIHDEQMFILSRELDNERNDICQEITKIMIDFPEISVPLATDWKCSYTTWENAKEFNIYE